MRRIRLSDNSRRAGMEDTRFLDQQANWCYRLAWQSLDLTVAHELNLKGNELTARSRGVQSAAGTSDPDPNE